MIDPEFTAAGVEALENTDGCLCCTLSAAGAVEIIGAAVLHLAADKIRAKGNLIATGDVSSSIDPRAGAALHMAEGAYMAADLIRPDEE